MESGISPQLVNALLIAAAVWLTVLIIALLTLSRRRDLLLPVKLFWAVVIFFAPLLGLLFYLVFGLKRGGVR
jgi:hypothetical protein